MTQTSVYPREVVLRALHHQASAVVLAHNHPSRSVQPSRADEALTQTLKTTLALIDGRVISDEFDVSTLLETDDRLSFRRSGIGTHITHKLRRGDWSIQRQLDLHGLRRDAAREALGGFIREAHKHGIRCVRVVHGKGLGSPGKAPVLKNRVHSWLMQKKK